MEHQDTHPEISPLQVDKQGQDIASIKYSALSTWSHSHTIILPAETTQAEIEQLLANAQLPQRIAAAHALTRFGESVSLPTLSIALTDGQKLVRIAALEACAELAPALPVTLVLAALGDPEWSVRAAAVWALGHFSQRAPLNRLLSILHDQQEDIMVRASALHALGSLGSRAPIAHLIAALNDPEWHLREVAALSLGKLQAASAVEPLLIMLQQEDDTLVKIAVAHALATLAVFSEQVITALQAALHDSDAEVHQAIEYALSTLAKQSSEQLQHTEHTIEARQRAAQAVSRLRDYVPDKTLLATLDSDEELIKREILATLNASDSIIVSPSTPEDTLMTKQTAPQPEMSRKIRQVANVEFVALTPSDLSATPPIISQAMDNQWMPRSLLRLITSKKLAYNDIVPYLEKQVRTEYIRSLINGRNVVVNRAFFYNNPVISNDFLTGGSNREAFKKLLDTGVVMPFLAYEQSPAEQPKFSIHPDALVAWQKVCQEVRMACIRFDWNDEQTQRDMFKNLSKRFHNHAFTAVNNDVETYLKDFGLSSDNASALKRSLRDLTLTTMEISTNEDRLVTREDIYKKFVTADDTSPNLRLYDGSKAFSAEIKQYIDLIYNANLADALNGYLLTPNDTLPRSALQEWEKAKGSPSSLTVPAVLQLLRRNLFDLVQSDLYLKSMRLLSLEDVLAIRQMEEWNGYVNSLDTLLNGDLLQFGEQAPAIYHQYAALMKRITAMLQLRYKNMSVTNFTAAWDPTPSLEIDIGGAKAAFAWSKTGMSCTFSGLASPSPAPDRWASFSARLKVGDQNEALVRADLLTNVDFMKGRLDDALEQWKQLRMELPKMMPVHERYAASQSLDPTINEQEYSG